MVERHIVVPAELTVVFRREDASLQIVQEYSEAPWITVTTGKISYGLASAVEKLDPDYAKETPEGGKPEDFIAYWGRFFAKHADALLGRELAKKARVRPPPADAQTIDVLRRARALAPLGRACTKPFAFLERDLGFASGVITEPPKITVTFWKDGVRLAIEAAPDAPPRATLEAGRKRADLEELIRSEPAFDAPRPTDHRAILAWYAAFLRAHGAALLARKPSAWRRVRGSTG